MPASQSARRMELQGVVRGPVDWSFTLQRRLETADPTVFVCRPPEKRYDTALGRLLHAALVCATQLAQLSGLTALGPVTEALTQTTRRARRLMLHPKMVGLRTVEVSALRNVQDLVDRRPHLAPVARLVEDYRAAILEGDEDTLQRLLETDFLAPEKDSSLFELQVGFGILEALQLLGYRLTGPSTLLPAGRSPFAHLHGPRGRATVWWQRRAWVLDPDAERRGSWAQALAANHLSHAALRPDFVVDMSDAGRRLLVEVKLTASATGTPERQGLRDVLAYLHDGRKLFRDHRPPHALVAAWNAKGAPTDKATPVQITDQIQVVQRLVEALGV